MSCNRCLRTFVDHDADQMALHDLMCVEDEIAKLIREGYEANYAAVNNLLGVLEAEMFVRTTSQTDLDRLFAVGTIGISHTIAEKVIPAGVTLEIINEKRAKLGFPALKVLP